MVWLPKQQNVQPTTGPKTKLFLRCLCSVAHVKGPGNLATLLFLTTKSSYTQLQISLEHGQACFAAGTSSGLEKSSTWHFVAGLELLSISSSTTVP